MSRGKNKNGHTPMMVQYLGIKAQHPDSILLFRMGDFYETFYEDAETVAGLLGITLTSREKKGDRPIPLAGIPYHALDNYMGKLMTAGCTVAICEQVEDPAQAKGLVRREVVEVLSPGTVSHPGLLPGDDSVFLLALAPVTDDAAGRNDIWGYALLDGTTGEFRCGETPGRDVAGMVRRSDVTEVVVPEGHERALDLATQAGANTLTEGSALLFESDFARQVLCDHFALQGLEGLGLADFPAAACAAGAALRYLHDRQRRKPLHVRELQVDRTGDVLLLDRETVSHLELFEGARGEKDTTVFHHLNTTRTPMGRRSLARWLRAPLCDATAIIGRQDAVAWFFDRPAMLAAARDALRGMGDLERGCGRIATGRASPAELASLRQGFSRLNDLVAALESPAPASAEAVRDVAPRVFELVRPLQRLVDQPPTHLRTGGIFRTGGDDELDRLHELTRGGKQWIATYQENERQRTGIGSLKVGYNRVFGYYLEVTNPHLSKVPDDYQEKQTLANARRFITPSLKEREQQILRAEEDQVTREAELFAALLDEMQQTLPELDAATGAIATLDALASLADVARARGYVRPVVDEGLQLEVVEGRHPVVERIARDPFVPNDLSLAPDSAQLLLLTGPNMGGKSTYLRQTALLVVLAQMGSFVPAASARVGVVDRLFTRVGASDNLARGQSTFLVEMAETANILRNATNRSLVILDEVGRGTSTDDGLALAWAITEYLHDGPTRPKTLFATHFHQLTGLADRLEHLRNIQMEVREVKGTIVFLHRVVAGAADRSYGVHVAELAGVPQPVLVRARQIMADRGEEATGQVVGRAAAQAAAGASSAHDQLGLFAGATEHEVIDRLRAIDIDQMRPVEALQLLADLADRVRHR